jgi:bifunctional non-homologous end joining protein LigD
MPRSAFEPCIPTRGIKVPDRPEWIHEIKHDGYRLIVQREGKRVRLFTRNGHDWSGRYPRIVPMRTCDTAFAKIDLRGQPV